MRDSLFYLERVEHVSIQAQIREMLVSSILSGQLDGGEPLPSSRKMAKILGVSRNTVVLAYQGLVDDGYLVARERSGFYVDGDIAKGGAEAQTDETVDEDATSRPDWDRRYRVKPTDQKNIVKPDDWQSYPYPFIYGQVDQKLFPISAWRECSRQALGRRWMEEWTRDTLTFDDPMLVEQIRSRLLTRRGIRATASQILVTLGAQNALYILASLLMRSTTRVAMEDPGYPDARNIFRLKSPHILGIPVDDNGLPVDERLDDAEIVYVTPSHQFPTTATLPMTRRRALLDKATAQDMVIIEDDYEFETNYISEPMPALKSLDKEGRVLYVGSLSKTFFPGLRLGYVVGPEELIDEARALRRLMLRHPPTNNQRTAALFLSLGHHETLIHRLHRVYRERWERMGEALTRHLPNSSRPPTFGGTSYWVEGPADLDADKLAIAAREHGILIEPGRVNFDAEDPPRNYFRLGFSSIDVDNIEPGIEMLSNLISRRAG